MRTTVRLDPEVLAAARQLQKERHIGLGEAVNELARAELAGRSVKRPHYTQRTAALGAKIDVSNIADVLELLDDAPGPSESWWSTDLMTTALGISPITGSAMRTS